MVRESRFIKVKLIPCGTTEDSIISHFGRYGKVQSVRLESEAECMEAVVAFTDIKAASQAYNEDQMFKGAIPLSVSFCDATGTAQSEARCPVTTVEQNTPNVSINTRSNKADDSSSDRSPEYLKGTSATKSPSRQSLSRTPSRSRSRSLSADSSRSSRTSRSRKSDTASRPSRPDSTNRHKLGVKITHLPLRSSDTSLRDGLFHEYKKHGKVTGVVIEGKDANRFAIVSFKKPEEAEKALQASKDKQFFGSNIQVESHDGFECENPEEETEEPEYDEYHSKATRTLFCGNLEPHTSAASLRDTFKRYGEIVDVEIKKQGAASSYAFIQFTDIKAVVQALKRKDGVHIGSNKVKLGFGKSMPTNCVWLDDLSESVMSEPALKRHFMRFGTVTDVIIDKQEHKALITLRETELAIQAVNDVKSKGILGRKVMVDFASWDYQGKFREQLGLPPPVARGNRDDRFNQRNAGQSTDADRNVRPRNDDSRYTMADPRNRYVRNNSDYSGKWNEQGSMSPLDQRRDKSRVPSRDNSRPYDNSVSRSGYDNYYKGGQRKRSVSPSRSDRLSTSPSHSSRQYRFSRSPASTSATRSRYSRSPQTSYANSPRSPKKSTASPSTPKKDESRVSNVTETSRRSRSDTWSKPNSNDDNSRSGSKTPDRQDSEDNSDTGSDDSDSESNSDTDQTESIDDLQKKRNQLLSMLKGLEGDSPNPDSQETKFESEGKRSHPSTPASNNNPLSEVTDSKNCNSFHPDAKTESSGSKDSNKESKKSSIDRAKQTSPSPSSSSTLLSSSSVAKRPLEQTLASPTKADSVDPYAVSFKKRKKDIEKKESDKDKLSRKPSNKGQETKEIAINGPGPPKDQVSILWEMLKARECMSSIKPCELPLPKFAMTLMHSPRSPNVTSKRHSLESPLSSPALPSPATKAFTEFTSEKTTSDKKGIDNLDNDDNDGTLSPLAENDLDERIRLLNENMLQAERRMSQVPKDLRPPIDLSKYKIVRKTKVEPICTSASASSSPSISSTKTAAATSTCSLSLWPRSSIFDQDSKRLEGLMGSGINFSAYSSSYLAKPDDLLASVKEKTAVVTGIGSLTSSLFPTKYPSFRDGSLDILQGSELIKPNLSDLPSASSIPVMPNPPRGILRRTSVSSTDEPHRSPWHQSTEVKPQAVAPLFSEVKPDTRIIAEVKPLEIKPDIKVENPVESLPTPTQITKKEISTNKLDSSTPIIKQEKTDHSVYESSFGKQTEIKHETKPNVAPLVKRVKPAEFKAHVDLFKPDDDAIISTVASEKKKSQSTASKSTKEAGAYPLEKTDSKEKISKQKNDKKLSKSEEKASDQLEPDHKKPKKVKEKPDDKGKDKQKKKDSEKYSKDSEDKERERIEAEEREAEKQWEYEREWEREREALEREKEREKEKEIEKERQREKEREEAEREKQRADQEKREKEKQEEKRKAELEKMKKDDRLPNKSQSTKSSKIKSSKEESEKSEIKSSKKDKALVDNKAKSSKQDTPVISKSKSVKKDRRVVETDSSEEEDEDDDDDDEVMRKSKSSSRKQNSTGKEKTEEEKANWMAEYAPFYESMYDKVKRKRAAAAKAAHKIENASHKKGSRDNNSESESDGEESGSEQDSPLSSPVRPRAKVSSKNRAFSSDSDEPVTTTPPVNKKKTSESTVNKTLGKPSAELKNKKSESAVIEAAAVEAAAESYSEPESESDTAKMKMMKNKALAKLAKRPATAVGSKKQPTIRAKGKPKKSNQLTETEGSDSGRDSGAEAVDNRKSSVSGKTQPPMKKSEPDAKIQPAKQVKRVNKSVTSSDDEEDQGIKSTKNKSVPERSKGNDLKAMDSKAKPKGGTSVRSRSQSASSSSRSSSAGSSSSGSSSASSSSTDSSDSSSNDSSSSSESDNEDNSKQVPSKNSQIPVKDEKKPVSVSKVKDEPSSAPQPAENKPPSTIREASSYKSSNKKSASQPVHDSAGDTAKPIHNEPVKAPASDAISRNKADDYSEEEASTPVTRTKVDKEESQQQLLTSETVDQCQEYFSDSSPSDSHVKVPCKNSKYEQSPESISPSILKRMDAVIEAVVKGNFSFSDDMDSSENTTHNHRKQGKRKRQNASPSAETLNLPQNKMFKHSSQESEKVTSSSIDDKRDSTSSLSPVSTPALLESTTENIPSTVMDIDKPQDVEVASKAKESLLVSHDTTASSEQSDLSQYRTRFMINQDQQKPSSLEDLHIPATLEQAAGSSTESESSSTPPASPVKVLPANGPLAHMQSTGEVSSRSNLASASNSSQNLNQSRPQSNEQSWDQAVEKHIQKSLNIHKGDHSSFQPSDLLGMTHARDIKDPHRDLRAQRNQQRMMSQPLPQSMNQQPQMHSPSAMMVSSPGHLGHLPSAAEMMFNPIYHPGAGGDRMIRPTPASPYVGFGYWPSPGQPHGDMMTRFMIPPFFHQYTPVAQQSPLPSPLSHGLQMMAPHVMSHNIADDRKSTLAPTLQTAPQDQLATTYLSTEEQLRRILMRCPVVWQGTLALKADTAGVEMFFLCGNSNLPELALPAEEEGLCLLRIVQRMRLEKQQLDGVDRKIEMKDDYCILLALPSCDGKLMDSHQTSCLQTGFIDYLKEKDAAGIINVPKPGGSEPAFVVHVFYPCEFSMKKLEQHKPEMLRIAQEHAHLMIIIATV